MIRCFGSAGAALFAGVITLAPVSIGAQPQPRILTLGLGNAAQIGVGIREVTADDAAKAKLAQPVGAYVESVRAGSPAATAGLRTGDIVIDFDGERVRTAAHFTRLVQESAPNRQVDIVVVRGTARQTLKIVPEPSNQLGSLFFDNGRGPRVRELPRNFNFDVNPDALRRAIPVTGTVLGMTVMPLTDQLAAYFGVKQGVLVSTVGSSSPAAEAGIQAGDVITGIDGQNVTSGADITRATRNAKDGMMEMIVTRDKKTMTLKVAIPSRTPSVSGRRGLPL